jgi:hypothetical protein
MTSRRVQGAKAAKPRLVGGRTRGVGVAALNAAVVLRASDKLTPPWIWFWLVACRLVLVQFVLQGGGTGARQRRQEEDGRCELAQAPSLICSCGIQTPVVSTHP